MDLKCRKTACVYNDHFTCKAKNIAITSELLCDSFEQSTKNVRDTSRCMFEEPPEYSSQRAKKHMRIACGAKCLFNEQGVCSANGLTVNSYNDSPCCMTYLKP